MDNQYQDMLILLTPSHHQQREHVSKHECSSLLHCCSEGCRDLWSMWSNIRICISQ